MEEYELTDPVVVPEKVANKYRVVLMYLDMEHVVEPNSKGVVTINLTDNLGARISHSYYGQQAIDMMKWMNTANFSVNSMQKKVLQKLSNDGVLPPGSVTGTPETPAGDF